MSNIEARKLRPYLGGLNPKWTEEQKKEYFDILDYLNYADRQGETFTFDSTWLFKRIMDLITSEDNGSD